MAITTENVEKIAELARLAVSAKEQQKYSQELSKILDFVANMEQADTSKVEPLAHPMELSLRLRDDVVTATDQRELMQAGAPLVEAGLYLVPKVIDEEL